MPTFGNRPDDVLTDSKGNVQSGVTLTVYASQANANSQTSPLATSTSNGSGRWPVSLVGYDQVWVRDPNGNVWAVESETLGSDHGTRIGAVESGKVAKGAQALDLRDQTGVVGDGAADDATAIQTALDAAAALGVRVFARGTFRIGSTLVIKGSVDLSDATLNYTGSGVAVQIGSSTAGQLTRINVRLGHIVYSSKPAGANWTAGTVGLKVVNIFRSTIVYQRIQDFETNLLLLGDGTYGQGGVAYNTFHCGTLNNGLVNQSLQLAAGGTTPFVNQNVFIAGSWSHSDGAYPQSGMRQVLIGTTGGGSLNNNLWLNCSLEGQREEYTLDVYGNDNTWLNCRWEFSGTNPPVRWRPTAARNLIVGGYQVNELTAGQVIDSGATGNNILGTNTGEMAFTSAQGLALSNMSGGTNAALSIMRADWRRLGDTAANYMTKFEAGRFRLKNTSDTSDRLFMDYSARSIVLGAGVSASASGIYWGTGTPESAITAPQGATYYNYGAGSTGFGQYIKSTGTGNTGWHSVGFQAFTTAARPAASLAGIGGCYYDTTLSKPGFSDGTVWRDAAGTAI